MTRRDPPRAGLGPSIRAILEATASEIAGCRTLVVGDPNGLPVVGLHPQGGSTTTAMGSLALSAATKVTAGLGLARPSDVLIEAGDAVVIVRSLGDGFTLIGVVPADGDLGGAKDALARAAEAIREALGAGRVRPGG